MSIAALNGTLLMYTQEKADLTSRLMSIMGDLNVATANSTDLMEQTGEKRAYYNQKAEADPTYADSTEYKVTSDAVESDYQLQLANINSWESQLNTEKSNVETELKVVTTYEENWTTLLKENIKKDFTYGGSSSS